MMDDIPEIVLVNFTFSCQNLECEVYDQTFEMQSSENCTEIVCGVCGFASPCFLVTI